MGHSGSQMSRCQVLMDFLGLLFVYDWNILMFLYSKHFQNCREVLCLSKLLSLSPSHNSLLTALWCLSVYPFQFPCRNVSKTCFLNLFTQCIQSRCSKPPLQQYHLTVSTLVNFCNCPTKQMPVFIEWVAFHSWLRVETCCFLTLSC